MATQGSKRVRSDADRVISDLAERQHGIVSRGQLRELGLTDAQIKGRVDRRQLQPVHRGVYAVGHRVIGVEARWMAAVLACGSGAVLSHRSAGRLWQIVPRAPSDVELTRASGWRGPAGLVVHRSSVPQDERTVIDGIPVTGLSRTILDLAAVLSRQQVKRTLNEAEVRRLTDPLSVPDLLRRYPRRPGTAALREMLRDEASLNGITRNDFEERFAELLEEDGLPRPRFNADLIVRDRHFNVDCLWRDALLIAELDGGAAHRTALAFEEDRERDRILMTEGWRVTRVTWRQLRDDPSGVIGDMRRLLDRSNAVAPTL